MIKIDTGWMIDEVRSRPIKGWYVYTREIVSNRKPEDILPQLKPQGQSPVTLMHKDGERMVFTCSLDSGD